MIAIDTNVLLRYLLADDATQSAKVNTIIRSQRPILITDVVLAEAIWTLTGKRYNLDKTAVCAVVRSLIGDAAFFFENAQVIWSALRDYEEAKPIRGKALDFVDSLIINKAHFIAESKGGRLSTFYSFDKAVVKLKDAETP